MDALSKSPLDATALEMFTVMMGVCLCVAMTIVNTVTRPDVIACVPF